MQSWRKFTAPAAFASQAVPSSTTPSHPPAPHVTLHMLRPLRPPQRGTACRPPAGAPAAPPARPPRRARRRGAPTAPPGGAARGGRRRRLNICRCRQFAGRQRRAAPAARQTKPPPRLHSRTSSAARQCPPGAAPSRRSPPARSCSTRAAGSRAGGCMQGLQAVAAHRAGAVRCGMQQPGPASMHKQSYASGSRMAGCTFQAAGNSPGDQPQASAQQRNAPIPATPRTCSYCALRSSTWRRCAWSRSACASSSCASSSNSPAWLAAQVRFGQGAGGQARLRQASGVGGGARESAKQPQPSSGSRGVHAERAQERPSPQPSPRPAGPSAPGASLPPRAAARPPGGGAGRGGGRAGVSQEEEPRQGAQVPGMCPSLPPRSACQLSACQLSAASPRWRARASSCPSPRQRSWGAPQTRAAPPPAGRRGDE